MAAKLKPIKTLNELTHLTSPQTLGNKYCVLIFYDGSDAAAWKARTAELNDVAGDLFEEASLVGVDVRFFKAIAEKHGAAAGQARVWRGQSEPVLISADNASIKKACAK